MRWLVAVLLGVAAAGPVQAGFVVNGGFETGTFSPWVASNGSIVVASSGSASGTRNALFNVNNTGPTLSQTLTTLTAAGTYNLSFKLLFAANAPNDLVTVTLGGTTAFTLTSSPAPATYVMYSTNVTLAAGNPLLQFQTSSASHFYRLDDVDVTAAAGPAVAAPAPPTGLLCAACVGLAGVRAARRRCKPTSA